MAKSTAAVVEQRVEQILELLLAETPHTAIIQYGTSSWGVSARQVDTYILKAREQISETMKAKRPQLLAEHALFRKMIRRRALNKGDLKTALAASDSEAKLLGLIVDRNFEEQTDPISRSIAELNEDLADLDAEK